ncbi:MAG: hypothetical protein HOO67_07985 [Candidatus Peribacteraceae bacterium]|nr:hypothetical protein [Candidatus Peribacteraceae bacterium]
MQKNSWLYSDSFLKRAFAIWGHAAVAHLIIMVPIMILWFLVIALFVSSMIRAIPDMQREFERMDDTNAGIQVELQP